MKYCPVCREEFVDTASRCPDDNVALVDHLEPEFHEDDVPRKLLYEFTNQNLADMVLEVLEDNGITPLQKKDMFGSALSVHASSTVGTNIKFYVAETDFERAKDITSGMVDSGDENDT